MTKYAPLVSVIVPTYNRSEQVVRAVKSVLNQKYQNLECIVIDDSSDDDTVHKLNIIKKSDSRLIILIHDNNQHASAARNTGIAAATGDYIAFLDDDDVWMKSKLSKQVELLSTESDDVGLVYCWFNIIDGDDEVGSRKPELEGYLFDELLVGQPLGNASTLLIKKNVINRIGGFDTNLPRGNDGDFIRRATKYYKVKVVKEILVEYHIEHIDSNPRISLPNKKGILNDVNSIEVKLEKFSGDFNSMPNQHLQVLLTLFQKYLSIGRYTQSFKIYKKALMIDGASNKYYLLTIALVISFKSLARSVFFKIKVQ
jgi:glycosyltransferase involved in cell wall biosynthesis